MNVGTSSDQGTTNYSYDEAERLQSAGDTQYSYDANGNMTSKVSPDRAEDYEYDSAGRWKHGQNRATGF